MPEREFDEIPNHEHKVIIAGFGRIGQIVGRILRMHHIEFTAIEKDARQVDFVRKFGNAVYYGNPTNPELLRSAGIAHAELFVLTLDDPEQAVITAEYLKRTYPKLKIIARARDRNHYYQLREAGVKLIWRETYLSSLGMAHASLLALGFDEATAEESIDVFRDYDEELLERQQAVYDDDVKLVESARAAMIELEGLFDSDHHAIRSQNKLANDDGERFNPIRKKTDHGS